MPLFRSLLVVFIALGACSQADRFDQGTADSSATDMLGAPGSVDDPRSAAYFSSTIGDRVLFAVDQSTLTPAARATLDGQAEWLTANAEFTALIEGHADEQGTQAYNLALGARRASTVQVYLISQGIDPSRLKTISYGKERPIEICSEEACYMQNRRAVTVLSIGVGL